MCSVKVRFGGYALLSSVSGGMPYSGVCPNGVKVPFGGYALLSTISGGMPYSGVCPNGVRVHFRGVCPRRFHFGGYALLKKRGRRRTYPKVERVEQSLRSPLPAPNMRRPQPFEG